MAQAWVRAIEFLYLKSSTTLEETSVLTIVSHSSRIGHETQDLMSGAYTKYSWVHTCDLLARRDQDIGK